MPRQFFRKIIPSRQQLTQNKALKLFGHRLRDNNLWHLNRRSAAMGVAVGIFCAFLPPLPIQMIMAALIAIWLRANLPIAVTLVWISNPLTWIPFYTVPYLFGAALLGQDVIPVHQVTASAMWHNLFALLVGCLIFGLVFAVLGYSVVSILWRKKVISTWRARHEKRRQKRRQRKNRSGTQ